MASTSLDSQCNIAGRPKPPDTNSSAVLGSGPRITGPLENASSLQGLGNGDNETTTDDDDSDEPLDSAREHWRGSKRKYQSLIKQERSLYDALEQQENNDLAVHLYSTHAIKRRAYKQEVLDETEDVKTQRTNKLRWTKKDEWVPRKTWTAWPLRPEDVPGEGALWGREEPWDDTGHYDEERNAQGLSRELRDILQAEMTRHARVSFNDWQDLESPTNDEPQVSTSAGEVSDTSNEVAHAPSLLSAPGSSLSVNEASEAESYEAHTDGDSTLETDAVQPELQPGSATDDDQMGRLVSPHVQHIMSRLDNLLVALRRTRHNASILTARAAVSAQNNDQSTTASEGERSASRTLKHPRRGKPPQDWSEVVGLAATIGWKQEVLESAKRRCSQLFREDMTLHNLDGIRNSTDPRPSLRPARRVREFQASTDEPSLLGYSCPETSCSKPPFRFRKAWLKHIKKVHDYEYTGPDLMVPIDRDLPGRISGDQLCCPDEDCPRSIWPFPSRKDLHEHRRTRHSETLSSRLELDEVLHCPVAACHHSGRPFIGRSQLDKHVHNSHPETVAAESSGSAGEPLKDDMYGGVHVDNFMQLIPSVYNEDHQAETADYFRSSQSRSKASKKSSTKAEPVFQNNMSLSGLSRGRKLQRSMERMPETPSIASGRQTRSASRATSAAAEKASNEAPNVGSANDMDTSDD